MKWKHPKPLRLGCLDPSLGKTIWLAGGLGLGFRVYRGFRISAVLVLVSSVSCLEFRWCLTVRLRIPFSVGVARFW